MTGQTLSHYQILEKLGEGGMGVVYKARDNHLDRLVAVKVLPADRVTDADRKRRFVQEAKAASALNHPNIVTIYDIDQASGVDFIAMEYVSGKPLDQLVPRKGLQLKAALKYAVQMADALAAVHAVGIVHRDLKPGNVMVTESGLVKVLDFGLAKLSEEVATPGSTGSEERTLTVPPRPKTEEGVILGTVSYMSPEQAEGRPVDARSDIFSLGSVLYEMVTGRKAFQGETKLSTLTAILNEEPKRVGELVEGLPKEMERIISRCLRKEPSRRFQHMDDVKVELEELKEESDSGTLFAPALAGGQRRRLNLVWVAGLVSLLLVAATVVWFIRSTTRSPGPELTAVPLTSLPGIEDFPTFSPDGNQVAFMWNGPNRENFDIYVKLVGPGGQPLRLTSDPAADSCPAWSPDGRSIAFLRELSGGRFAVVLVPPIGGPERKLAEVPSPGPSVAWSPDGSSLAIIDQEAPNEPARGVFLLSIDTNEKRRLTSGNDYCPAFSPDGRTLAFVRRNAGGDSGDIFVLPLSSSLHPQGEPKLVMSLGHSFGRPFFGLTWTLDGREIIAAPGISSVSSGSLCRIAADGSGSRERLAFTGDEASSPSLSRQGTRLAYARGARDLNIWRLELAAAERKARPPVKFISTTRSEATAQFSPDGKKIAFYSNRSGNDEIWVCNSDGTSAVQVTSLGGPLCGTPRWSPDGEQIAFDSSPDGHWDIFVVGASGGKPRRLTNEPFFDDSPSWSRDGKWVYFCSNRSGTKQIWRMPPQGGEAIQVTRNGGRIAFESPDGKFVYYTKSDEGKEGLWRMPFAGGEETQVINSVIVGGRAFSIIRDGVYFITGAQSCTIQFLSFRTHQNEILATVENPVNDLTVSPDGRSILYTQRDQSGSDLMLVENFR